MDDIDGMKYWTIVFPGEHDQHVQETWSESQILKSYYDYWCSQMLKAKKHPFELSEQRCIEDWCVIHWAQQTDQFGNRYEI